MKRTFLLLLSIAISHFAMAQFTADNLVVARVESTTNTTAGSISLMEYMTDGTVVGSPITVGTGNFFVSTTASTLSDGMLSLSTDGKYLTMYGYSVLAPNNDNIQSTTASACPRILATIDGTKVQNLIPIPGIHDITAARCSMATLLGTNSYGVYLGGGKTSSTTALQYVTLNTTNFSVSAANSIVNVNTKSVKIFNNQLYNSASFGTNHFNAIGTGVPSTAGQTINNFGAPINNLADPGDFVFFGNNLLYITDETATTGGVYKFYSADNGATWTAKGKVNSGIAGDLLFRGLAGRLENGKITLYAVTTLAKGNNILKIVDETAATVSIANGTVGVTLSTLATSTSTTGFRGISFTPNSTIVLPVALDNFNAKNVNGAVELNWATYSEQNNKGFDVQHSINGENFVTIADVKGQNNSSQKNTYSFTDKSPVAGVNYYQLKQTDNNGKFTIYGPKAVSVSFNSNNLSVYANSSWVKVNLYSAVNLNNLSLSAVNSNGQKVASSNVQITKGLNVINIPVMLIKGVYILNIQGDGLNDVKKFIVQ